jgi:WD40 repeat protein
VALLLVALGAVWLASPPGRRARGQEAGVDRPPRQEGKWQVTPIRQPSSTYYLDEHGLLLLRFSRGPSQLWDTRTGKRFAFLQEHEHGTGFVCVTPDGSRLVTGDDLQDNASLDNETHPVFGKICIRERATGKVLKTITVDLSARGLRGSNDWDDVQWLSASRLLLHLQYRDPRIHCQKGLVVIDVDAGRLVAICGRLAGEQLTVAPDGKHALAGRSCSLSRGMDGGIAIWSRGTAARIDVLDLTELKAVGPLDDDKPAERSPRSVVRRVWAPDSRHVATIGSDCTVRVWDLNGFKLLAVLKGHTDCVFDAAFSPDSRNLLTVSEDGTGQLWDARTGQFLRALVGHTAGLSAGAWAPAGGFVLTGGEDETARLWDAGTGRMVRAWPGHESGVCRVAFLAGGQAIETRTVEGFVRRWSLDGKLLAEQRARDWWSDRCGALYLKRTGDDKAEVWSGPPGVPGEPSEDQPRPRQVLRSRGCDPCAVTRDGKRIASAGENETVWLCSPERWDKVTGAGRVPLADYKGGATALAFSPDGKTLAVGNRFGQIKLWDVEHNREGGKFRGHREGVRGLVWSPDGNTLASSAGDREVVLWSVRTGRERFRLTPDMGEVAAMAFTADGERLALAGSVRDGDAGGKDIFSRPGEVRFFDVETGKERGAWGGFPEGVISLAVSPDGKVLAAADRSGTVRLWGLAEGRELAELNEKGDVRLLAFSPDGKMLAGGPAFGDKPVVFWDVASRKEVGRLQAFERSSLSLLTFTADGQTLVIAGPSVKLWDVKALSLRRGD